MRWSSQEVKHQDDGRLPGVGDAVIRRFDAPEALDIRFHEVRTKSALNRVPGAGYLPFSWTVNPYRGCTHACVYCLSGDTPILLADGRTRPIAELQVGDEIYGTVGSGAYRRYVRTEVRAHWATVKPAFRMTLEDGTELVASGDHRFLTPRGWKHVTGVMPGAARRPYLTLSDSLMGTGRFAAAPAEDADYRRGYLAGLIRGDGHVGSYAYARGEVHRTCVAPAGEQAPERASGYLRELGFATDEFVAAAAGGRRSLPAVRDPRRADVARVQEVVAWPWEPSDSWRKGFLAGIFDAEGRCSGGVWRVASTGAAILEQTTSALDRLGFGSVTEDDDGLRTVRLLGGTAELLRFFHTVDPAITRKGALEGRALESHAKLGIAEIEPLGVEVPMYDISTGTGDFIANGVVSHNCFARPTHEYLDMNGGRDFEREIIVKVNVPEVLRAELARPSWKRESVALGTNTDPYQWVEGRYKLMRGIWEALRDHANPCSILTKSPLVLRDVDLLKEIAQVTDVSASLSIPTLGEKAWRATEPHTPHPRARLEAVAELNRQGIPTGILIAPLMPGINDAPEDVARIVEAATDAGATYIGGNTLFLRGSVRELVFEWLREHRPDLVSRYERLYANGAYVPQAEKRRIERAAGAPWAAKDYPADRFRHRGRRRPSPAPPAPVPKQERLF
jgi:DNA repair photolyase